jgi:hypothetical protein
VEDAQSRPKGKEVATEEHEQDGVGSTRLDVEETRARLAPISGTDAPGTGESHKTSAASLVMFDKDGKIIWRAP